MIICLEGINGCGKSTIGKLLAQELGGDYREHPNKNTYFGMDAHSLMKKDPNAQYAIALSALDDITASYSECLMSPSKTFVWSRCQLSTMVYNLPYIEKKGQEILNRKINELPTPDLLFYLDVPINICYQRLCDRSEKTGETLPLASTLARRYGDYVFSLNRLDKTTWNYRIVKHSEPRHLLVSRLLSTISQQANL